MDQIEEVTAEFRTEEIKKEAEALPAPEPKPEPIKSDHKSWIPVAIGLITLAIMATIAFRFWLVR